MKPNRQYFVVSIDKEQQKIKREKIVLGGSGYLGVRHSDQPDFKGTGVLVTSVEDGSPAFNAGLKAGDIIFSVNGHEVETFELLVEAVAKYSPGDAIVLEIKNSLTITDDRQQKTVKLGKKEINLENPETLRDMRHNLQFGKIIDYGKKAAEDFPHAKRGDYLLFHHSVEYKPRTGDDPLYNDYHLIDHDSKGNEIRIVYYEFEVLGVLKMVEGKPAIIPHPRYVFCHYNIQKASMQKDAKSGLWFADQWNNTIEELNDKLEELKAQIQEITSTTVMKQRETEDNYKRIAEIRTAVKLLNQERKAITRKMHQPRLVEITVLFYNKRSTETLGYDLSAGDKLICDFHSIYPLDIQGVCYSLARIGSIEGAIFQKQPLNKRKKLPVMQNKDLFKPLHDRIIVKAFEQDILSPTGILIIPETVSDRPARGEVIACGPGKKDQPMEAKVGDIILFNKLDGTDFEYIGSKYLAMREDGILTTLQPAEAEKAIADNNAVIAKKKELDEEARNKRMGEPEAKEEKANGMAIVH